MIFNASTATTTDAANRPSTEDLPDPRTLPEVRIYSHSTLVYWWPVWLAGYVMAALTYFRGGVIELDKVRNEYFHPSASLGIIYITILLLVIIFTNTKMRGIYSVVLMLVLAFFAVLFAWLGWWDDIADFIPHMSVHMNMGFYLFFSTALLILWMAMFFVFDRLTFWRVRPGQLTEERMIGGGEQSYDVRGMLFEQHGDDFFRHRILGVGAGDLCLRTTGAKAATINIPNVMFAESKVRRIQKLIAVKPDELLNT